MRQIRMLLNDDAFDFIVTKAAEQGKTTGLIVEELVSEVLIEPPKADPPVAKKSGKK